MTLKVLKKADDKIYICKISKRFHPSCIKIQDTLYQIENSKPGPKVIKKFSCSTQKFFMLINVEMPTVVVSRKNSILGLSGPEKLPRHLEGKQWLSR